MVYKDTFHFLCFVLCFCWLKATGLYLLVLIEGTALTVWGAIEYSFPFIAIPLFTIGLYSSLLKESSIKIPSSIWMLGAMSVVCAGLFILIKSNIIAHGALNCIIVVAGVLAGVYTLTPHNTTRYLYISKLHNTSCTHEGSYVYGGRMGGGTFHSRVERLHLLL